MPGTIKNKITCAAGGILLAFATHAQTLTIDGGLDNTFAVSHDSGALFAWGGNVGGKLGNGTTLYTAVPVPVSRSTLVGLAAGFFHTCSWSHVTGAAQCWGLNLNGQVGDGTSGNERWQPVAVSGLASGVASMALGTWHSCAVTTQGGAKCWGSNFNAQLGFAGGDSNVPVDVPGLASGVAAIAAGERHTCALTTAGGLKCWGDNQYGQLGNGNNNPQPSAVDVNGLASGVAAITAGLYHTCALTTAGSVKCWGRNDYGQLGIGSQANTNAPGVAAIASDVESVAAGSYHTCAVTKLGAARCWGDNLEGQVGDNSMGNVRLAPTNVANLSANGSVIAIAPGFDHTCALTPLRQVLCWGKNASGEVGDNTQTTRLVPTATWYLGANVASLAAGGHHSCGLYKYPGTNGTYLLCWGQNAHGELGNNSNATPLTPQFSYVSGLGVQPLYPSGVSAGMSHTLAVDPDGFVWAWGANDKGQLGVGWQAAPEACALPTGNNINCSSLAIRVPGLTNVIAVGAGWGHSIALKDDGTVWAWGDNQFGQAGGDLAVANVYKPRQVAKWDFALPFPLGGISRIAAGYFHNLALKEGDGTVLAWGRNNHGQLGNGGSGDLNMAYPVSGLAGVQEISSKGSHNLALSNGSVWAWGLNAYGQIGNGSTFDVSTPVQVQSGIYDISAGMSTSMSRSSGTIYSWGLNNRGQLGTSSTGTCSGSPCRNQPGSIPGYFSPNGFAAMGAHGLIVRDDDSLSLFGDNTSGQLAQPIPLPPTHFTQDIFDPAGMMFPLLTEASGTSIGASSSGTGLSLLTLGASIDFGIVSGGSTQDVTVKITNLEPVAITFIDISVSGGAFSLAAGGCSTLTPLNGNGGSCNITLVYDPGNTADTHYGTLEIQSNAPDNEMMRYGLVGASATSPSAPTGVTAVAGDQSATVSFYAPSSNGGAPISYYTVLATPGGATATGTSSGIVVGGLTNNTSYTFTVTATNSVNRTSPPSSPSNSVTPRGPPSSALASSQNPAPYGTALTFTATFSGALGVPTGAVAFRNGAQTIAGCGAVALVSGVAQCPVSALSVGSWSITAQYAGDGNYTGTTAELLQVVQAVAPSAPTNAFAVAGNQNATVTFSPPSFNGGAPITSYTVTASPGGASASGTNYSGGIVVGGLANGTAYTFVVTAKNSANLTSAPSAPSNSVTPHPAVGSNVVTSSLNPSSVGASVTLTATLSGSFGVPTGTIDFRDGGQTIAGCGSVSLVSGVAQCSTTSLPAGLRSITAVYSGDGAYSTSTSPAFTQTVLVALTSVTSLEFHGSSPLEWFEIAVDISQPLAGSVTVDPRKFEAARNIFFLFNGAVGSANATITAGNAYASTFGSNGFVGVVVENVPNNTRFTLTLGNLNGTGQSVSVSMAFAMGDVDNSRSVTMDDVNTVKIHAGETAVAGNARHDVNRSGAITSADILAVKGRLGATVP